MKCKRYSVEQIVAAVKQHEQGTSAVDISRKLGIVEQTFYRWKKQYDGLEAAEVREMRTAS
jgi:putative transposase